MALIPCKECSNEVSSEAKTCPKCGAKVVKPKKPVSKVWIALGVVIFMTVGYVSSQTAKQEAEIQAAKPPAQLAAEKATKAKQDANFPVALSGAKSLKSSAKDPQAFEFTTITIAPDGAVCYEYRAKNSFGAELPGSAVVSGGKLLIHEQNGNAFVSAWNKSCAGAGNRNVISAVKMSL